MDQHHQNHPADLRELFARCEGEVMTVINALRKLR